jgi:hypothetical protein
MIFAAAFIVGIVGIVVIAIGIAYFVWFSIGSSIFEGAIESDDAEAGEARVASAVWKISNLFLGKALAEQVVAMGGEAALPRTRHILAARKRTGLLVASAGLVVFVASFFTGSWLR